MFCFGLDQLRYGVHLCLPASFTFSPPPDLLYGIILRRQRYGDAKIIVVGERDVVRGIREAKAITMLLRLKALLVCLSGSMKL